jgi:hypothetical protein
MKCAPIDENVIKAQICAVGSDSFEIARMAKRGVNLFKKNDGLRALKIARDGGIEPAMIEIVAKDGTTFRVYGDNAAPTESTQDTAGAKEWAEEIAKLKAKPK